MSEPPPRPEPLEVPPHPRGSDRMQTPGVATRPLLLWTLAVFALGFVSAGVLWGAYRVRVASTPVAVARPFPAPQLETNQTPRATASTSHGPGPYRPDPADTRTGEARRPSDPLEAAMQAEAARGTSAYDPVSVGGAS